MKDISLADLRSANIERQKEWDVNRRIDLAYRGNELAGEVGEACNIIKKLERERHGIRGSRATLSELADELADVIICVDLIAMAAGIDMVEALGSKFNATSTKYNLATRLRPRAADLPPEPEITAVELIELRARVIDYLKHHPTNFYGEGEMGFGNVVTMIKVLGLSLKEVVKLSGDTVILKESGIRTIAWPAKGTMIRELGIK